MMATPKTARTRTNSVSSRHFLNLPVTAPFDDRRSPGVGSFRYSFLIVLLANSIFSVRLIADEVHLFGKNKRGPAIFAGAGPFLHGSSFTGGQPSLGVLAIAPLTFLSICPLYP